MKITIECESKEIADFLTLVLSENRLINKCTNKIFNEISESILRTLPFQGHRKDNLSVTDWTA